MSWKDAPLAGAAEEIDAQGRTQKQQREREIGLAQRTAIQGLTQGALGIPAFVGDVAFGAVPSLLTQALGGQPYSMDRLTPFSSSVRYAGERLADVLGKPRPETPTEKSAVGYGTTGVSAASGAGTASAVARAIPRVSATAPSVMQPAERLRVAASELGVAPVAQTSGALGAQAGADVAGTLVTEETDPRTAAALRLGGMGAGLLGGATISGVSQAGLSTLAQPFTTRGRETAVGTLLRSAATDPEQAIFNLERATANVPRVAPLTADAARDIGLAGFETGVRSSADITGQIAAQRLANARVLRQEMDRLARTSDPAERDAIIANMQRIRGEMTAPMREQAFSAMEQNVNPSFARMSINLVIGDTLKRIAASDRGAGEGARSVINWMQGRLDDAIMDPKVQGDFFKRLYEIRKDLRAKTLAPTTDEPSRAFKSGTPVAEDIIRTIDDLLDAAAGGGWKEYLDTFATASRRQERIGLLQDIQQRSIGTTADIESGRFMLSAPAMTRAIRNRQSEINETLTSVQQKRLNNILLDLQQGAAPTAPGVRPPTSGTVKNITMANLIGRTLGGQAAGSPAVRTLLKPLEWLTNVPEEKAQELLVDAMLDPKIAALLMKNADPKNVTTFSDALRETYRGMLYTTPRTGLLTPREER